MIPRTYPRLVAEKPVIDATSKVDHTRIGVVTPIIPPPVAEARKEKELRCEVCGAKLILHDEGFVCPNCGTVYQVPLALPDGVAEMDEKSLSTSRRAVFEHDHAEWYVVFKVLLEDPYLANRYKHEAEKLMRRIVRHVNRLPRKERIPFLHYFILVSYLVLSKSSRVPFKGRELFERIYYAFNLMRPPFPILRHVRIRKSDVLRSAVRLAKNAPEEWMKEELGKLISDSGSSSIFEKI